MLVHHNHKTSIASFTETFDGLGYMLGRSLSYVQIVIFMFNFDHQLRSYLGLISLWVWWFYLTITWYWCLYPTVHILSMYHHSVWKREWEQDYRRYKEQDSDCLGSGKGNEFQMALTCNNKYVTFKNDYKEPLLLLPFIDTGVIFSSITESFWEPHLKNSEASATQYQVGMVFFLLGISYMVASFIIGAVCEWHQYITTWLNKSMYQITLNF